MNKLVPLALTFLAACTCGGYDGGGDRVLARGTDMLILCENGGFYANVAASSPSETGLVEGMYSTDATGTVVAHQGANGEPAFTLTWESNGGAATEAQGAGVDVPSVGNGEWTENEMNEVELDHANILCTDLESRSWWAQGA